MGQPRSQMIAGAVQENLRLIFEPAKCARMNDAGAVALKLGPVGVALLSILSSARVAGLLRERREGGALGCFHLFAGLPTVLHWQLLPGVDVTFTTPKPWRRRVASISSRVFQPSFTWRSIL